MGMEAMLRGSRRVQDRSPNDEGGLEDWGGGRHAKRALGYATLKVDIDRPSPEARETGVFDR